MVAQLRGASITTDDSGASVIQIRGQDMRLDQLNAGEVAAIIASAKHGGLVCARTASLSPLNDLRLKRSNWTRRRRGLRRCSALQRTSWHSSQLRRQSEKLSARPRSKPGGILEICHYPMKRNHRVSRHVVRVLIPMYRLSCPLYSPLLGLLGRFGACHAHRTLHQKRAV